MRSLRAAVPGLLLVLLFPAAASAEPWTTHTGDDSRWSRPDLDDANWPRVDVRSTWREQGRRGYDGIVWYRGAAPPADGLLLGPPVYGGYEVYADGRLIGRSRGWSSALGFGYPEVFRLPPRTTRLALR